MRNGLTLLFAVLVLGFGGWTIYSAFRSTPNEISLGDEPEEITYLCTETGAISRGEWQPMPALNPVIGKKTLVQALYCSKCKTWYKAPPAAMQQQSPRGPTCALDGSPLTTDGPLPPTLRSRG